jgi:hypothetical protein
MKPKLKFSSIFWSLDLRASSWTSIHARVRKKHAAIGNVNVGRFRGKMPATQLNCLLKRPHFNKRVLKDALLQYKKCKLPLENEHFNDYCKRITSFWQLAPRRPALGSYHFCCTCPAFQDYAVCKHSLGISVVSGKTSVPDQWKINRFEDAAKRGRPKGATKTLQR